MKVAKILAHTFSIIVKVATILLVVVLAMYMFILPRVFGQKPYVILSGSMEPTIPTGSLVFMDTSKTDPKVDDIIAYRLDGAANIGTGDGTEVEADTGVVVTHRVYSIRNQMYIMKGDNNDTPDVKPIYKNQIIGTLSLSLEGVGFILAKVTEKKIKLFIIGIVITLNIAALLFVSVTDDDEKDEEKEGEEKKSSEEPKKKPRKKGKRAEAEENIRKKMAGANKNSSNVPDTKEMEIKEETEESK